jgi:gamma-glutamyltranspeptidase/glutathione hydrolase
MSCRLAAARRPDARLAHLALTALAALLLVVEAGCATAPRREIRRIEARPAPNAVVTAHPLATRAASEMLERGGSPVDAAVAAQMMLGLVEPQSSGVGGGTLLMIWDARSGRLTTFDGLASAPGRTTAGLRVDIDGTALPRSPLRRSGRAVGVPGTLPAFKAAHERFGRLPWRDLFEPAIRIAEAGFPLPPYLHAVLAAPGAARSHPDLVPLYFGADGKVLPVGSIVRNPDYARTLRRIAERGPGGLLDDGGAERIVAAARRGFRPSLMTEADLRAARAVEREPVCGAFLVYRVCTMGPPSYGGIAVLQILQMVEMRAGARFDFDDPVFVHLYAEAGRLAQTDRRYYVGDPAFVAVPAAELVAPAYLRERAKLIDVERANPAPEAGRLGATAPGRSPDDADQASGTSQMAIADASGNAVAVTTTINLNFGSRIVVDGFVLNNALVNFSAAPEPGEYRANQMAPGKRPVSAMAPTIVFGPDGRPVAAGGSAGAGFIVDYLAASLIEMLANGRTPAEALARGHVSTNTPGQVRLEASTAAAGLAPALAAKGHAVEVKPMVSGLAFLLRKGEGWLGAADPRRDGVAEGW